jgi:hypothetical protein
MNVRLLLVTSTLLLAASATQARDSRWDRSYSARDLHGTWTFASSLEASLPIPFPAEITQSTPPSTVVAPGDVVTLRGTVIGLFEFDGEGGVQLRDFFKAGNVAPLPFPYAGPAPEQGHGTYTVDPDGIVQISTVYINGDTGDIAGEADYVCTLNRLPQQLSCMFARFKTYVVDPGGFEAPIQGLVTMRPQY